MKLKLAYSPCPNDTFIFDAIAHNKIDTEGLEFDIILNDVETLNHQAFESFADVTKISYHAYAYASEQYQLLHAGSALGRNCGPLLISARNISPSEINSCSIAIPGRLTTANLLLSIAFPNAKNKKEYIFSEIENALLKNEIDTGVIIHEQRFTYINKGLKKIIDLGEYWEKTFHLPIPLGAIAVNRNIDAETKKKINRVLKRAVEFAMQNPQQTMGYVSTHAQELDDSVIRQHINLYVNNFTVDLGLEGIKAVNTLFNVAFEMKIMPQPILPVFIQID